MAMGGQWQQKLDRCRSSQGMQRPPVTTEHGRDREGFFLELQREQGPAFGFLASWTVRE